MNRSWDPGPSGRSSIGYVVMLSAPSRRTYTCKPVDRAWYATLGRQRRAGSAECTKCGELSAVRNVQERQECCCCCALRTLRRASHP
eukprot:66001-Chlamydomonas_euryale.AAC.5